MDARADVTHAEIRTSWPIVDEALAPFRGAIGDDWDGYRNHVLRVLNFCAALGDDAVVPDTLVIAAAFHDLGIWSDRTFDYLAPSAAQARAYTCAHHAAPGADAVERAILQHHRIRPIRADDASETFRRADWIDVTFGALRFGLPRAYVSEVRRALPDRGFHARLLRLAAHQCLKTPFNPLPMLRW